MKNDIKVQVSYKNYRPLHDIYQSFRTNPPEGVKYVIPEMNKRHPFLFYIYRQFGDFPLIKSQIHFWQQLLFQEKKREGTNLIHYIQRIPHRIPRVPYVVDFEHIVGLSNFISPTKKQKGRMVAFLKNPSCKAITPLSMAAKRTLKSFMANEYEEIKNKVEVIYPAIPDFKNTYDKFLDHSLANHAKGTFKLLFIGNDIYVKGLHELLTAFKVLRRRFNDISLFIISDAPKSFQKKHMQNGVFFYPPTFSKKELASKFLLPLDLLILPTHRDSFGMVLLDALSSGMPVVTTDQFAAGEIVSHEEDGLLIPVSNYLLDMNQFPTKEAINQYDTQNIDEDLVAGIEKAVSRIYKDRSLFSFLKQNTRDKFKPGGKFSINTRNAKLKEIYEKALR